MERNWVSSDEASMANPLGGIRRGWPDIREFYERIFRGLRQPSAWSSMTTPIHRCGEMFYAVGREHGVLQEQQSVAGIEIPHQPDVPIQR